ncbi:MAG: nucleotidyltransferase domain-containing protein [Candidatus Jordarchaeales archaeon]|nr:nucleotidyltransferase domain-containing protein [Candidatus Jordarchaeia archaeon]
MDEYAVKVLKKLKDGGARFGELRQVVRNPRTLSKKLKMLRSEGLVFHEKGFYRLSDKGKRAIRLLEDLESILSPGITLKNVERLPFIYADFLSKYCEILYEHFSQRLVGVLVFGSVAKGNWDKNSDIDLLVVVEGWNKPVWERTRELLKLRRRMRETPEFKKVIEHGYSTSIQHYPLDASEALNTHKIYIDACIDGIILYEKNGFLSKVLGEFREKLSKLGSKRVTTASGKTYWVLKQVDAGEVFEL